MEMNTGRSVYCRECGARLSVGAAFCGECGAGVAVSEATPANGSIGVGHLPDEWAEAPTVSASPHVGAARSGDAPAPADEGPGSLTGAAWNPGDARAAGSGGPAPVDPHDARSGPKRNARLAVVVAGLAVGLGVAAVLFMQTRGSDQPPPAAAPAASTVTGGSTPDSARSSAAQNLPPATPSAPSGPASGSREYTRGQDLSRAKPIRALHDVGGGWGRVAVIKTPSGNIGCDFATDGPDHGCGVVSRYQDSDESNPRWWIDLSGGGADLRARGDVAYFQMQDPPAQEVAYGSLVMSGDIACLSEESGLTCWNTRTGAGAKMSRASVVTFFGES